MPLLHDVLNAYLSPLLKKHSVQGGFLTYEDLEASLELAKAVLVETPNEFVLKRVQKLHNSQISAYNETAKKALEQWAQTTADIPAVQKGETQTTYVKRCLATTASTKPNWHATDAVLDDCVTTNLRKRALQQFQQFQQQQQQNLTPTNGVGQSQQTTAAAHNRSLSNQTAESGMADENGLENDDEEGEVGEEEEDGEMQDENDDDEEEEGEEGEDEDGEVGEEEDGQSPVGGDSATTTTANNNNNNNNNQTTAATTNKTGNNVNPSKKRKPQKQIGGATAKKRVPKKKVQNQKKGPSGQKTAATGGKKVVPRKKGMAGKKRGSTNNKAA